MISRGCSAISRGVRRAAPCLSEVEVTDYGVREFAATDPDGNLIRVGHVIEHSNPRHAD